MHVQIIKDKSINIIISHYRTYTLFFTNLNSYILVWLNKTKIKREQPKLRVFSCAPNIFLKGLFEYPQVTRLWLLITDDAEIFEDTKVEGWCWLLGCKYM